MEYACTNGCMIRKIVKYGDPVLEQRCEPVDGFDEPELHQLVADMFETMKDARGIGLAAPQIGLLKRLTVIDCSAGEDPEQKLVLINPEILETEGEQIGEEGCLSIPGFQGDVKRAQRVVVRARDAKGGSFELRRRRSAGARDPPRERSSERGAVPAAPDAAQAGTHQAQDPEVTKKRRVGLSP